jgi:hypothetical protein
MRYNALKLPFFDSRVSSKKTEFEKVCRNWRKFAKSCISNKAKWDIPHSIQDIKKDKSNCGIYVCTFLESFLASKYDGLTFNNTYDAFLLFIISFSYNKLFFSFLHKHFIFLYFIIKKN